MKILVDPESGELYEVQDDDLVGGEPYDYAGYRRMTMGISREHRAAINAAEQAGKAVAKATTEYHRELALAIPPLKKEHGATIAEQLAKGEENVYMAKERLIAAEATERAAMERVRMIRDDRSSALTMGAWSREAGADGWNQ